MSLLSPILTNAESFPETNDNKEFLISSGTAFSTYFIYGSHKGLGVMLGDDVLGYSAEANRRGGGNKRVRVENSKNQLNRGVGNKRRGGDSKLSSAV